MSLKAGHTTCWRLALEVHSQQKRRQFKGDTTLIAEEVLQNCVAEIVSPTPMVLAQLVSWTTGLRREPNACKKKLGFTINIPTAPSAESRKCLLL